jgi:hypothetical protein
MDVKHDHCTQHSIFSPRVHTVLYCTVRYTGATDAAMLLVLYCYDVLQLMRLPLLLVAAGASGNFQKGTFAAAIFNFDAITLWGESATNSYCFIFLITFSSTDQT